MPSPVADGGDCRTRAWPSIRAAILLLAGMIGPAAAQPADELAAVHPELWPTLPPPPPDAAVERLVSEWLGRLSVPEKVGQIIQADIASITPEDLLTYPLGSILNGGSSSPGRDEYAPPQAWLDLADAFHDANARRPGARIPLLWGTDAVHGHNNIVGATIFPHNIALGATRDAELVRRIGEATATEVAVTGEDWTFAPAVSVARDDHWGRTYESYSEDPAVVAELGAALVEGLQGKLGTPSFLGAGHVLATAKHFLGDGGTFGGKDQGDNRMSEAELRDLALPGYVTTLRAGVQTVMASYSSWQGRKMHGNADLLTGILKGRLGFDGFVIGDWNGHAQLPGCTKTDCPAAINAGVDMLMAPDGWKELYARTLARVEAGEISDARLDDAVRRILRVKARAGLFEKPRPSQRPLAGQFELLGAAEHRALARRAVRESLVLLKNEGGLLPLSPAKRILVAGAKADDIGAQSGGWSLTWQGTGNSNARFPHAQSILAGIREATAGHGGVVTFSPDGAAVEPADVAIVVIGETPYAETKGDIRTTAFDQLHGEDLALVRKLHAAGLPVVTVFLSGRPLWVDPILDASAAFVAAWLPGSEGGGVADLLIAGADGRAAHDFRGRLAFSWPSRPDQVVNIGDGSPTAPRFPFGFGLTYAAAPVVP